MTDNVLLAYFEKMVSERGIHSLTYDDQLLFAVLKNTTLTHCPLCSSELKHSIFSQCAGHGEFPRYLKIRCNGCSIEHVDCISYGKTWKDAENAVRVRCAEIAHAVAESLRKEKGNDP